jgi:hypothetical protein
MKAYVTKVDVIWGLVYHVTGTYATKDYVTQHVLIKFIVSLRLVSFEFDVIVIKAYICHKGLCELGLFY